MVLTSTQDAENSKHLSAFGYSIISHDDLVSDLSWVEYLAVLG